MHARSGKDGMSVRPLRRAKRRELALWQRGVPKRNEDLIYATEGPGVEGQDLEPQGVAACVEVHEERRRNLLRLPDFRARSLNPEICSQGATLAKGYLDGRRVRHGPFEVYIVTTTMHSRS